MSIYNKKIRDKNGRIPRQLTCNQINRTKKYASAKQLHFVLIPRHRDNELLRQIVAGFDVEEMVFNNHPHKPTLYNCCL